MKAADPHNVSVPVHTPAWRRYARLTPFLVLSVGLHLVALLGIADWRRQERNAEIFRARLMQVVRFEPRRVTAAQPMMAPRTQMEYRPSDTDRRLPEAADPSLPEQPLLEVPEAAVALRPFEIAARPETFQPGAIEEAERQALMATLTIRDSMRRESLELLRLQDLAQGRERAVVLVDPDSQRDVTGFLNLTRVFLRGAGGGRAGLDALARYMRDHTDLLVQVRGQSIDFFTNPELMNDPVHFLIEDGGLPRVGDWPLLQVSQVEKGYLEAYMRSGGLLFFEGSYRYLAGAVELMQELLGADAGIAPIPASHPLYHSFYSFAAGFPGEVKEPSDSFVDMTPSWYYPGAGLPDAVTTDAPADQSEALQEGEESRPQQLGLWGVSLGDTLVAVVSDLSLHTKWVGSMSADDDIAVDGGPSLVAGTNLIVHALTRTGSVAKRRALPAWVKRRPRSVTPEPSRVDTTVDMTSGVDTGLYDALDASLALVRSPLGAALGPGGVRVRVDGRYGIDVLRADAQGIMLHNLPPGPHWVEIEYAGSSDGIDVDLRGGLTATVTFDVSRLAMLSRLRLRVQEDQVAAFGWVQSFAELDMEEVFFGDEGEPIPLQE